jgi:hypothetical protein
LQYSVSPKNAILQDLTPYQEGGKVMKFASGLKKMFWIGLMVAGVLAIPVSPLFAEEEKPTGDLTVSALSQYIWR